MRVTKYRNQYDGRNLLTDLRRSPKFAEAGMAKRIQTVVASGVDHMPRKQTILERLRSLLWREPPEVRNTNQGTEASSPGAPLALEWATYEANKQKLPRHEGEWVVIHG